ncbi:protein of unknown function [Candidatus Filomicrobium marinum]|uniref:Uncharacterized protein n=1 Tax=Candidatus Filomicrobium marinum TaxID=1608628 RepID=A0A0D6JDZ1_9HYPH|nr:protein of unknown function [Candidatus Filomicrobium marinum]CPR18036.1 protein of unknown function [Candidatus Filomicrobium marinum]
MWLFPLLRRLVRVATVRANAVSARCSLTRANALRTSAPSAQLVRCLRVTCSSFRRAIRCSSSPLALSVFRTFALSASAARCSRVTCSSFRRAIRCSSLLLAKSVFRMFALSVPHVRCSRARNVLRVQAFSIVHPARRTFAATVAKSYYCHLESPGSSRGFFLSPRRHDQKNKASAFAGLIAFSIRLKAVLFA